MGLSSIHEVSVQRVLDVFPEAKRHGFMASVREAVPDFEWDEMPPLRIIPDAFLIDQAHSTVVAFEVDAGNPVDDDKMRRYSDLWFALDDWGWDLILITTDRWGNFTHEASLRDFTVQKLVLDAQKRVIKRDPAYEKALAEYRSCHSQPS